MKKYVTLAIVAFTMISMYAQDGTTVVLLNYKTLTKKVANSDSEIQNPKKNIKATTWLKRGELYQDVFMIGLEQLQEGMASSTLTLFYKEPKSIEKETKEGSQYEYYIYDNMTYTFVNGTLQGWKRNNIIHEDPLSVSMEAFKKALELDEKGKMTEKITENLAILKGQFKRDGVNSYYKDNYAEALSSFENVLEVNKLDFFSGELDTIMVQYSGIISREIAGKTKNNDLLLNAIGYYQQLAEVGYGGPRTYLMIKMDWMTVGDTLQALESMKEAYEKYPDTVNVIVNVADIYMQLKDFDGGHEFTSSVIESNPNIAEAYYWNGRFLINKEDIEFINQAIESYKKAGEIDPSLYYVWYDLGYIYYLQGADFYDRANTEVHEPTRVKLLELGKEKYEEAIPILEKSSELNDTNSTVKYETMDLLQRIYYKEQKMEDYERVKALKAEM